MAQPESVVGVLFAPLWMTRPVDQDACQTHPRKASTAVFSEIVSTSTLIRVVARLIDEVGNRVP
jgi:hypothetical protein